jgi:hypothetical protein
MRRLFLGLGALALTLTTGAASVNAADYRGRVEIRHEVAHRYYETHGVRFAGGYYYRGFEHHHWARQVWDARLNRWHYYDADLGCYFYWSPAQNCYYPVTYVCP